MDRWKEDSGMQGSVKNRARALSDDFMYYQVLGIQHSSKRTGTPPDLLEEGGLVGNSAALVNRV